MTADKALKSQSMFSAVINRRYRCASGGQAESAQRPAALLKTERHPGAKAKDGLFRRQRTVGFVEVADAVDLAHLQVLPPHTGARVALGGETVEFE